MHILQRLYDWTTNYNPQIAASKPIRANFWCVHKSHSPKSRRSVPATHIELVFPSWKAVSSLRNQLGPGLIDGRSERQRLATCGKVPEPSSQAQHTRISNRNEYTVWCMSYPKPSTVEQVINLAHVCVYVCVHALHANRNWREKCNVRLMHLARAAAAVCCLRRRRKEAYVYYFNYNM